MLDAPEHQPVIYTKEDLAKEVLRVLELQQRYFELRTPSALREAKQAERVLKKLCGQIVQAARMAGTQQGSLL